MSPRRPQSSPVRGFTLIEILVICALIALLSGIAVFQVKAVMDQTRVKATYADLRGVADSLSTAYQDLGMFPKLGFLSLGQPELFQNTGVSTGLPDDFELMGFSLSQYMGAVRSSQIVNEWKGPYFNAAGGRSPLKTGTRGYYVQMQMPRATATTPLVDWPTGTLVEWPADPWGNPYVVYLLHQDPAQPDPKDPTKFLPANPPHFVRTPYEEPNYFAAVVSYGPNGMPGGSADPQFTPPSVVNAGKPFRLFKTFPDPSTAPKYFIALTDGQPGTPADQIGLTNDGLTSRILSLSMNAPYGYLGAAYPYVPGILDSSFKAADGTNVLGSDDIIVPIR